MTSDNPRITVWTSDETLKLKIEYLADKNIRTISGQAEYILKLYIDYYEQKFGTIDYEAFKEKKNRRKNKD